MKKEYISPFVKIAGTTVAEKMLSGSTSQGFGNSDGGTTPDVEGGLTEEEGDGVTTLSKYRNSFYE